MKPRSLLFWIILAACASTLEDGCGAGAAPAVTDSVDISTRLKAEAGSEPLRRHVDVTRTGRRVDATVLVAPATARASLNGLSGSYVLRLSAAQVFNIGDGMQMDVLVVEPGRSRRIYSRYFDAGRKADDRAWVPIEVPLTLSGAGDVYLEIKVSGGPQGDLVADWLAFAGMVLEHAKETR